MIIRKAFLAFASILLLTTASLGNTAEITLRAHHFLPATSTVHTVLVEPWAKKVEAESKGRIKIELYPSMQLGGKPPQLFNQVRDGVVDIVWTLPGYTAGRFPVIEVFELPFVSGSAKATTLAMQTFATQYLQDEFKAIHPILFHAHAPGTFHMKGQSIQTLEDLKKLKIRAPTRVTNNLLTSLGATAIGMPVPAVPQALSKGVIDGALLPYEVTRSLRVHELTDSHTAIAGSRGIYTAAFLFAMNKTRYESLPDDLQKVIDNNSGSKIAAAIGTAWDKAEKPALEAARALEHAFFEIGDEELDRWKAATQPVINTWVQDMDKKGYPGQAILDTARQLVERHSTPK